MSASGLVSVVAIALAAFGLSYWAFRARTDRSAFVGLYLLFGIPATLLASIGLAQLLVGEAANGALVLLFGFCLGVGLLPPVRRLVAAVTPMDARSPVDMTGLCLLLATPGLVALLVRASPDPTEMDLSVDIVALVSQAALELVVAYAAVGWWFARSLPAATARLGIVRPTGRAMAAALGCVLLAFLVSGVAGALGQVVQPEAEGELTEVVDELTAEVQNPAGALILGASAGIGEEAIFRGALQPRFGIGLTSVVFALIHLPQYGLNVAVLGLLGVSLVLGWEARRFGTTAAMVTHALYNAVQVLILAAM